jgi:glycosyltransferase involved in cell wall biosynthesis
MQVAIDAVGIRGHGGAAVLCELLYWLPTVRPEWHWHVFLFDRHLRYFDDPVVPDNVTIESVKYGNNGLQRLQWIDRRLSARLGELNVDAIFAFANIGSAHPIVPQTVFCHQLNAFFSGGISSHLLVKRTRLWFMRRCILRGAKSSQAMIVQTEAMRNRIVECEPGLGGRVHVIPSGYRTPAASPTIRPEKKKLIDEAPRPRLIYVSHPSEHKNHETLVKSLGLLVKRIPEVQLLLTIERDCPPNRRYASFSRQVKGAGEATGVADHLVWLGQLNPDEVTYALQSSDLMVFPSLAESFGLGLVEAMAVGCPVVAADLSYAHDVCKDAALYFDPLSSEAIAQTVERVLGSKMELDHLKEAAQNRKSLYSYKSIASEIADVIEQCIMLDAQKYG